MSAWLKMQALGVLAETSCLALIVPLLGAQRCTVHILVRAS